MNASIIVNTYNRADYLQGLLDSFERLCKTEFEVIVVNGPSTDRTSSILRSFEGRIKVVDCPSRNLSHSRNLGIAASAGDIVVFIDDDARPVDRDWLYRFVNIFENNSPEKVGAVGGSILRGDTDNLEYRGALFSEYSFQKFNETENENLAPDGSKWLLRVPGGNSAYLCTSLKNIGGFDEIYSYYNDETDVCMRLINSGYKIKHLSENKIRHYSASSERRINYFNRNWDIISKSDAYFSLKNAKDAFPIRLINTLRFAGQKHFVYEVDSFLKRKLISYSYWLRLKRLWFLGLLSGLWFGLTKPRQLRDFRVPPPPFLPFISNHVKNPLRIALVTSTIPGQPGFGGIGRYTFDLARGLHQRGHEVHIICRDENPIHYESLGFFIHGITNADAASIVLDESRPIVKKNIAFSVAVEKKLASLYAQGIEFDIVHASNWDAEPIALIREHAYPLALMLVTPLAQVVQTEKWGMNDDLQLSIALDRWQIEHADVVCVPSHGVLKSYESLMDIHPDEFSHLEITPLGIIPEYSPAVSHPPGPRRLLFVGRLEWRKGIHTLLEALPDLMQRFPDWECHIVGNDQVSALNGETFKQEFQKRYSSAPWLNRIIFHGMVPQDELLAQYQSCDLFVAPSLFESFGLIFQEAMQYGKPVVGCLTGGIPEVVEHGVEGLLVAPDQPEALGAALARLMQDDELRLCMGNAARERIHKRDNYQTMAAGLEGVYRLVVAKKGARYKARRKSIWNS